MKTYTCRHCGGLLLSEKLDSCGCSAAATEELIARRSAAACSLSSFIGFAATKDFRSSRRAMRAEVGDTFVTRRDGVLIFSQVDWTDETWIGIGRFEAESGEPLGFVRIGKDHYRSAILAALRMGCEFRPVNAEMTSPH